MYLGHSSIVPNVICVSQAKRRWQCTSVFTQWTGHCIVPPATEHFWTQQRLTSTNYLMLQARFAGASSAVFTLPIRQLWLNTSECTQKTGLSGVLSATELLSMRAYCWNTFKIIAGQGVAAAISVAHGYLTRGCWSILGPSCITARSVILLVRFRGLTQWLLKMPRSQAKVALSPRSAVSRVYI